MKYTGKALRARVLFRMREAVKAGEITQAQYKRALKIRFAENAHLLGTSLKVEKNRKKRWLTAIVYLAPEKESVAYGGRNLCPFASPGCPFACLATKGRLYMTCGRNAKAWKTLLWAYCPDVFKTMLHREVYNLRNRAVHLGFTPAVRLNGASDIVWERKFPALFHTFPDVVFYDYTKIGHRVLSRLPSNYHLTFSRSEVNEVEALSLLRFGVNVAIVFTDVLKAIETGYKGFPVIDGDETDARPIDDKGVIVGLSPKGRAKDFTGFFVHN